MAVLGDLVDAPPLEGGGGDRRSKDLVTPGGTG